MENFNVTKWILILSVCFIGLTSCNNSQNQTADTPITNDSSLDDIIKHGEYLVGIMGCNDCHSPKRMGPNGPEIIPELLLSGFPADTPVLKFKDSLLQQGFAMFYPDLTAAAGPWGMSFAANLTPDETGIGNWTEEQFIKAVTQGKFKGMDNGRMLLPPMPVQNFKDIKEEDVKAIFAYLKSIQPVNNLVPPPVAPTDM